MADLPDETPITDEDLKKRVLDNLDALDRRGKLRVFDFTSELTWREPSKVGATGGRCSYSPVPSPKKTSTRWRRLSKRSLEG